MAEKLLTRATEISFNDGEQEVQIWTCSPVVQRQLARLGFLPEKTAERDGTTLSHWYRLPKKCVKITAPRKPKNFTDEQRKALAERARIQFSRDRSAGKA